jgi:uncharacterized membrane protein
MLGRPCGSPSWAGCAGFQIGVGAPPPSGRWDVTAAVLMAGALLVVGAALQKVDVGRAAVLLLCGSAALILVAGVVDQMKAGRSVELITHSGGLGGAFGGWKISGVAVMTILIVFLVAAILALTPDLPIENNAVGKEASRTSASAPPRQPQPRPADAASARSGAPEPAKGAQAPPAPAGTTAAAPSPVSRGGG